MRTKTTTRTRRYATLITEQITAQHRIMEITHISEDTFYEWEFETGCLLIDEYFRNCLIGNATDVVIRYKRQLLQDLKHGYWSWYVNHKRQYDTLISNSLKLECGTLSPEFVADHYTEELRYWTRDTNTHNKLRHFLTQSSTLNI